VGRACQMVQMSGNDAAFTVLSCDWRTLPHIGWKGLIGINCAPHQRRETAPPRRRQLSIPAEGPSIPVRNRASGRQP
jgi:hypothetical protein